MRMTWTPGSMIAVAVFIVALVGLLVGLPAWAVLVMIGALAVARLVP